MFQTCNSQLIDDIRDRSHLFDDAQVVQLIQTAGEIVFVPSDWHHQVHNLVWLAFNLRYRSNLYLSG